MAILAGFSVSDRPQCPPITESNSRYYDYHRLELWIYLMAQARKPFGYQSVYGALSGSKFNVQTFSSLNFETSLFAYNYFLIAALFPV